MASELLASSTTKITKSFVDNVVTPQIKLFTKECGIAYKSLLIPKGKHFLEYLNRAYDKYSNINTLVFHNSQRQLKDIYVAQTIVKENRTEEDADDITKIDKLPIALIKKYKKILITDTAGMGKSTIMKSMFIHLIDSGMKDVGIPIYIELSRLNKSRTIISEIQEELNSLSKKFDNDLLLRFIQNGGFIFFLDGYDEISIADRDEVRKDIQKFVSKAGSKNYYILTSRPEDSLPSFGDFQSFRIQPLTKKEAFELLKKYDVSQKKEISKELIDLLKSGRYESIDEYLENPLLVSLLYAAFDHKQIIPLKKHLFYRQVYDALYDAHKLAQGQKPHEKRSVLDIDDFNRVLRYVGFDCLKKIGVRFNEDTILNTIKAAKDFCGNLKFNESSFFKDLLLAVPLFCKEGTEYKWAHKSLMEYFAARFVAEDVKEKQDKILSAIYNSEHISKYYNMLDLYYDIDLKGFSKNITLPLCERFIKFHFECLFKSKIKEELIEQRISCLFLGKCAFMISKHPLSGRKMHNIFNQRGLGFGIELIRLSVKDVYVHYALNYNDNLEDLVTLLRHRNKSLNSKNIPYSFEAYFQLYNNGLLENPVGLEYDRVYVVDLKKGYNNEETYKLINLIIIQYLDSHLDYVACKNEAERIRGEIAKNNNSSDLLDGI